MNKKGSFFIIGGLLLLAAALLLTGYNLWDDHRAAGSAAAALRTLHSEIPEIPAPDELPDGSGSVPTEDIPDYIRCPEMAMPTVEIDGRRYIGVLTIPGIALELPVISQWSDEALKAAPCRYAGSAYMDSLVIAAHNYTSHFGRLKELAIGDAVLFTDADGNVFAYEIIDMETLAPEAIPEMTEGDWDLTLFTCTLGGQNRIAVRCARQ